MRRTNPLTRSESLYAAMEQLQRAQAQGEETLIEVADRELKSIIHGVPLNWNAWSLWAILNQLEAKGLLTREIAFICVQNSLRAIDATIEHIAREIETCRPPLQQLEMQLEETETDG